MKKPVNKLFFLSGMFCFLAWGFAMGRYEAWPFREMQRVKLHFLPFKQGYTRPPGSNAYIIMRSQHLEMLETRADIVMLGDSLTEQGEWQEIFPSVKIANRGISTDTTSGMLQRLAPVMDVQPRKVLLMGGINDLAWGGVGEDLVFQNIQEIVRQLRAGGVGEVVVQSTILPGKCQGPDLAAKVLRLNKSLSNLADDGGVRFIDLNPNLAPDGYLKTDFTLDGIHLNGRAYRVWAENISSVILEKGISKN